MSSGIDNLDIAADEAFARAEGAATAQRQVIDRDSYVRGYRDRALEAQQGPWQELLTACAALQRAAASDPLADAAAEVAGGEERVWQVVRLLPVPAGLFERMAAALDAIAERSSTEAEPVDLEAEVAPA